MYNWRAQRSDPEVTVEYRRLVIEYLEEQGLWCHYIGRCHVEVAYKWESHPSYEIRIDGSEIIDDLSQQTIGNLHNPESLPNLLNFLLKMLRIFGARGAR